MTQRWTTTAALVATTALLVAGAAASPASAQPATTGATTAEADTAAAPPAAGGRTSRESQRLAVGLAAAVRDAGFDQLVDYTTVVDGVAQPARALPNVDVAVIELDRRGHVVGAANVLYDRDSPEGHVVELDRRTLQPQDVRFTQWRGARWDDQADWDAGPEDSDVLAGPADASKEFMVPYPASVLKVMVAYGVLSLVDEGTLDLDQPVTYRRVGRQACAYAPEISVRYTLDRWLEQMTTVSDNVATCVLLQLLHDTGGIERTNAEFARLGLTTLRMEPSQPEIGTGWSSGRMTMGALDTARLMLLVAGTKHELWRAPDGSRVTGDTGLSRESQDYYRSLLLDQSFHEVLSTGNLCGSQDSALGIPALVPERWLDPETGNVVTAGIDFGYDARPCNEAAEVTFAHKTGLVTFSGNDAGIVRALPGEDGRWYVVAVHSNAGYRFGDADQATSDPDACTGAPYVCYPRAYARLGAGVDALVEARPRSVR